MPPILIFFAALAVAGGLAAVVAILVGARRTDPVADAVIVLPGLGRPGLLVVDAAL